MITVLAPGSGLHRQILLSWASMWLLCKGGNNLGRLCKMGIKWKISPHRKRYCTYCLFHWFPKMLEFLSPISREKEISPEQLRLINENKNQKKKWEKEMAKLVLQKALSFPMCHVITPMHLLFYGRQILIFAHLNEIIALLRK